jgi:hypothetical protein
MLGRLGTLTVVLTVAFAPTAASATPGDFAATHTYLTVGYTTLRAAIASMHLVGGNIDKVNAKLHRECGSVGAGSPQNEESQQMSYEVFGALLSSGYHTDAKLVAQFVGAVRPLRWSNPKITRHVQNFATSLHQLAVLPMPDLCGDVRAWKAVGFATIPTSTTKFDQRVEAIEGSPVPPRQLAPYIAPADKALALRDLRLYTQLENLERQLGQDWWDQTLETLAVNQ